MMYTLTMKGKVIRTTTLYRVFSTSKTPPLKMSFNHGNKVELISAIESIYNDEWRVRGVLPFKKEDLQNQLLVKENFCLDPIDYYQFKKSEIPDFLYVKLLTEASRGFIWLNEWVDDDVNMIGLYQCRQPIDLFLMTALSRVLIKTIANAYMAPITTNVSTLNDLKCNHYQFLNRQQNVEKVFRIDLTPCMKQVRKSRILKYYDNETCKGVFLNLVKQIIELSIYDNNCNKFIPYDLIPPVGEITNVILHIFYQRVVDKVLEAKYPGITYTRWGNELIIVIKKNDSFTFDDDTVISLLEEIDLDGDSDCLSSEDYSCLPACNGEKAILLHEDGCVSVWRYEDL